MNKKHGNHIVISNFCSKHVALWPEGDPEGLKHVAKQGKWKQYCV